MDLFAHAALLERTTLEEKPSQCQQILDLFIDQNGVASTGDFLNKIKIAQYNARIFQLRAAGWIINKEQHLQTGSWIYRLTGRIKDEIFIPFSSMPKNQGYPIWNS